MNTGGETANRPDRNPGRPQPSPEAGSRTPASAPDSNLWRTKYTPDAARRYQFHTERKDRAESRLVERAFAHIALGTVLDIPCGGGRMSRLLAQKGYTVTAADLSAPMRDITRENARVANLPIEVTTGDVEQMEFSDQSFDTVFSFRLFHHFPNRQIRARVIGQLCRVARTRVVISYFSPWAGTSVKRAIQGKWFGYKHKKFATSLTELKSYFDSHGFRLRQDFARRPLLHTLHLALFEKR